MSGGKVGRDGTEDGRYFEEQVRKAADPYAAIDSSLDLDALVAKMAELALLGECWREHVPHDAAGRFFETKRCG